MVELNNTEQPASAANISQYKGRIMLRRYREQDIPYLVEVLREYLQGTRYAVVPFSEKRLRRILENNAKNDQFFGQVSVKEDGLIVGGLCAYLVQYIFADEVFADEMCFFILPEYRSLKLAREFLKEYEEWAKRRRAFEMRLSTTSGVQPEEYGKFLETQGFQKVGQTYSKEI